MKGLEKQQHIQPREPPLAGIQDNVCRRFERWQNNENMEVYIMKAKRKIFAGILAGVMAVSAFPATAFAAAPAECEHTYVRAEKPLKEGSCTEKGIWKMTCSECGDSYYFTEYAHEFEDGYKDADCVNPAMVGEVCRLCQATNGEMTPVEGSEPLGHDMAVDENDERYVKAKCDKGGHDVLKCSRCDYEEEKDTEALGHSYDEGEYVDADCENGAGVMYTCTECGDSYVDELTGELAVPALGHEYEDEVVAPTCQEGGYTEHTCSVCG